MEVALRRRLEGVQEVAISLSRQSVQVTLDGSQAFSAASFRQAVDEAGVEVAALRIEACGVVERAGPRRRLIAGKNRFLLERADTTPVGVPLCAAGRLDDGADPPRLEVGRIRPLAE
ncbi:MAG TPA: hypothetical protein VNI83_00520 [Vicinamibacterales bacterium]|nr:hypothetical protein [Vicinamibacterales bacterium]